MFDPDNQDDDRRSGSLLSVAPGRPARGQRPASLLTVARDVDGYDNPAVRHHLARSRRDAAQSPLLGALAQAPSAEETAGRNDDVPAPATRPAHAGQTGSRSRWSLGSVLGSLRKGRSGGTHATEREPFFTAAHADRDEHSEPGRGSDWSSAIHEDRYEAATARSTAAAAASHDGHETGDGTYEPWRPLIDPMAVIGGVARSWKLIAFTTILGAAIGVMVALSTPRKYEAFLELLVDPRDVRILDSNLTESGLPSDATIAIVENQTRVLTSGTVLTRVVDKLNLASDPEFNGELDGGLSVRGIISDIRALISGGDADDGAMKHRLAVGNLGKALDVSRSANTFVIVIGAKTRSADKSALIANTVASVFLDTYGEIQAGVAGRATNEIESRLDELRAEVEAAERKVGDYKARNDLVDAQGRLIADDEILKLNDQLTVARARTLELNARAQSAREFNIESVLGGSLPEEISSSTMTELRTRYANLKQQQDRLAVRLGPRHPERLAVEAELAGARDQMTAELRRIVSSAQTDLKRAIQLEQELAARLAQLKVQQGDRSNERIALRELEREAAAKRSVYEAFLLRARQTGEQQGINAANMTVISAANPPLLPSGPSRAVISIAGMLLGFMSGVGLGAVGGAWRSLRDNSGRRPGAAEAKHRPDPATPRHVAPPPARVVDTALEADPPQPANDRESWLRTAIASARRRQLRREADDESAADETAGSPAGGTDRDAVSQTPGAKPEEQTGMHPYPHYPPHVPVSQPQPYPQQTAPHGWPQPAPAAPGWTPAPQVHAGWQQGPQSYPSPQGQAYPPYPQHMPASQPHAPAYPPQAWAQQSWAPPVQPAPQHYWAQPTPAWPPQPAPPQPAWHEPAPDPRYWQQHTPVQPDYAPPPAAQAAPPPAEPAPRAAEPVAPRPARRPEGIDGIRASLREFREAVEDYAAHRPRD